MKIFARTCLIMGIAAVATIGWSQSRGIRELGGQTIGIGSKGQLGGGKIGDIQLSSVLDSGVELKAQINLSTFGASAGNDCWGYTSPSGREYALMGLNNQVAFVEITNPSNPVTFRTSDAPITPVTEKDWTDIGWNALSAYVVSKTEAERAAWSLVEERAAKMRLTTIHPGFVLGPALDADFGTSIGVIRMFMAGAYPATPPVAYPIVDVRDAADLHVAALKAPATGGRRLIAAGGAMSMAEMAAAIRRAAPERSRKVPTATMPEFLVRLLAHVDRNLASVVPDLGARPKPMADYVTELTGLKFRTPEAATAATVDSLIRHAAV